jgi:hypothetical protein
VPRGKEFVLQNSPALLCCRIFQFLVAARKRNSRFVWPKMPGVESDPVASGYVASLAHPGGNLTGLFLDAPTLCGNDEVYRSFGRSFPDGGGLMSYGPDLIYLYRRLGPYVSKILRGAHPADLPIERPTKFELVVNLKAAKALGVTIPDSLLATADDVIE